MIYNINNLYAWRLMVAAKSSMRTQDWTQIWHHPQLDLELLRAYYVAHAFPRHAHEYYVVCLITQGRQSFRHQASRNTTPPGRLIFIRMFICPLISCPSSLTC